MKDSTTGQNRIRLLRKFMKLTGIRELRTQIELSLSATHEFLGTRVYVQNWIIVHEHK